MVFFLAKFIDLNFIKSQPLILEILLWAEKRYEDMEGVFSRILSISGFFIGHLFKSRAFFYRLEFINSENYEKLQNRIQKVINRLVVIN
jgi:hypothetical protein